jgi:site-specific recombinase XerD
MKARVKLYKNDGANELGFPVKLILSHERKTRRKTIAYSPEHEWNPAQDLPLNSHDDFEDLYGLILDIRKKAVRLEFRQITDFDLAFAYLLEDAQPKSNCFYTYADSRVEYMEKRNRKGNASAYRSAKVELQKLFPTMTFKELTPQRLQEFKEFKKADGKKNSTIKTYLIELRAIYNTAVRAKLTEDARPFAGMFTDIPVRQRRQRNRYLKKEDVIKLQKVKFEHESLQRAVDLSLLQFYLCGLDFLDIYYLKKENIIGSRVILTRGKLADKGYEFDVLLPKPAKELIKKYEGSGEYVFTWRKDYTGYCTFINNQRRALARVKELMEITLAPKDDTLTTKVMRHTFATFGKYAHIEEDLLRELMGHERNDIDTVYKDKYPEAERDAAQLKIISLRA